MAQISKYLFETEFGDPEGSHVNTKDEEDNEVETPVFSEAELLSAREHGYEAGIAAGQAQALAGIEKSIGEVIAGIDGQLGAIAEQMTGQKALAAEDVAILAGAIATKVTGTKSDQARLELLERMINDCMAILYQAPEVTARVPADLEAGLSALLAGSELAIRVSVIPDSALSGTDCHISWRGGGAERVEARIWQEVENLLERYVAGASAAEPTEDAAAAQIPDSNEQSAEGASTTETEPLSDGDLPSDLASEGESAPTQPSATVEPDAGQPPRPAPGDQDG